MAITSASEFEAVINLVSIRVEKVFSERGAVPALDTVLRDLRQIFEAARVPGKLKPLRGSLEKVTDLLAVEIPDDNGLLERLWDLADYIDYRG